MHEKQFLLKNKIINLKLLSKVGIVFYFFVLNLYISFLNLLFLLYWVIAMLGSDSEDTKLEILISNCIFIFALLLLYVIKITFFPVLFYIFKKNRFFKYLKYKLKRNKKFGRNILISAVIFDFLVVFFTNIPNNIIEFIFTFVFSIILDFLGGGVFLSYLGLVIWFKFHKN